MGSSIRRIARHMGGSVALGTPKANGSVSGVTASSALLSPGAGPFTYAWRMLQCDPQVTTRDIVTFDAFSATGWGVTTAGDNLIVFAKGSNVATFTNAFQGTRSGWNDWALVGDASDHSFYLYLNGLLVSHSATGLWTGSFTAAGTLGLNRATAAIGGNQADLVYDVAAAWTAAQVLEFYRSGRVPASTSHRWPLDEGAGTSARNTLTPSLPLTLSGGAAFSADSPMIGRGAVRNFLADSDDWSTSSWAKAGCTATASTLTATATAAMITQLAKPSGSTLVLAYYVLKGQSFTIKANDQVSNGAGATFDGTTGAYVGASSVGSAFKLTSYGCADAGAYWLAWITVSHPALPATGASVGLVLNKNKVLAWGWAGGCAVSDTLTAYGAMLEDAFPGQTSPSPRVPTGAAPLSVYGARETRQNLWKYARDLAKTSPNAATIVDYRTLLLTAVLNAGTNFASVPGAAGATYTVGVTLSTDTGTKTVYLGRSNTITWATGAVTGALIVTTTPKRFWLTFTLLPGESISNIVLGGDSKNAIAPSAGTVYVDDFAIAQASGPFDLIPTNGAPANSSGAPRSLAGVRTKVTGTPRSPVT